MDITFSENPAVKIFRFRVESQVYNLFHVPKTLLVHEFNTLLKYEMRYWYWNYMERRGGKEFVTIAVGRDFEIKLLILNRI